MDRADSPAASLHYWPIREPGAVLSAECGSGGETGTDPDWHRIRVHDQVMTAVVPYVTAAWIEPWQNAVTLNGNGIERGARQIRGSSVELRRDSHEDHPIHAYCAFGYRRCRQHCQRARRQNLLRADRPQPLRKGRLDG